MPITHTVVIRLAHPSGSREEEDFLTDAAADLRSIPGVQNFRINWQVSDKSDLSFQFAMEFETSDAYDFYNEHPAHVAFVRDRWAHEVAEFQEYDFVGLS
ncbi:MAG: Dabb family protein [Microbacterium sp.]|jgi:Stress responsive A/B Barrel Domain|uniref:Dabb family protein n=1 Tax=Microbacterium sp. TaxID=51671 RepID=UPI001AD116D4|nr:Dabb family protein [Microbacterium sp.]MBN9155560.1 Dabb family protein [Microbacterium sp.]